MHVEYELTSSKNRGPSDEPQTQNGDFLKKKALIIVIKFW
jgi:hypothetical protein